jgi:hypothetical protein
MCIAWVLCCFVFSDADRIQTALDSVDEELKDYPSQIKAETWEKDNATRQGIYKIK